jgi:hypothetical protein
MRRNWGLVLAAVILTTMAAAPSASAAPEAGSFFQPEPPLRMLDTRSGPPVGQGQTITLDLSEILPDNVTAVVMNVTGTEPTAPTFVTVYPYGIKRPNVSTLNLNFAETRPNLVTVAVDAQKKVNIYNNAGNVHLLADVSGYYTPTSPAKYTSQSPVRVMDTRINFGDRPARPFGAASVEALDLSGVVPAHATAVTFNLTGTEASTATFVTAWPWGQPRPNASNLNLSFAQTAPNLVTVELSADKKVALFNNNGTTHLIADLAGYYSPETGSLFTPLTPQRVLDTREDGEGPVEGGSEIAIELGDSLPATTTGLLMNLTGTQPTSGTHVTAWPTGTPRPNASNLNLTFAQTASNAAAVGTGSGNAFSLFNSAGSVHLIADIAGYFSTPPAK